MKSKANKTQTKKQYSKPVIKRVKIDNQISMVMMSPPLDPGNTSFGQPTVPNPFKI